MGTYYNGDKISFGECIIDTIRIDRIVLEIVSVGKRICLTQYNAETKAEIDTLSMSKSDARELISALAKAI